MQDDWALFFHIHKWFLGPDHGAWQAAEAERKLQNSCYDGKRIWLDWDKYVALHKEQHAIMESLIDYGYSRMDNGTKVHHFLRGIKRSEFKDMVKLSGPNQRNMAWILM